MNIIRSTSTEDQPGMSSQTEAEPNCPGRVKNHNRRDRMAIEAQWALKRGEVVYLELPVNLDEPMPVDARSFNEIVARQFDRSYYTYVHYHSQYSLKEELMAQQDKRDLIDMSDVIYVRYVPDFDICLKRLSSKLTR